TPRFGEISRNWQKKHTSLKADFSVLLASLAVNPKQGAPIRNECYKIRLAIASKGKGKTRGTRIITNIVISDRVVYLLTIYDKSEKENVSVKELKELLSQLSEE
ncbi:MAG: hypothetical protein ACQUHE_03695, partial [Bacteroidia bacterium]